MLAGPNGAGKSTYYRTFLSTSGLAFINADELVARLRIPVEEAATYADKVREEMLAAGESFITETVFSDPVGAKLDFLRKAIATGYQVELHFIGISGADLSEVRVAVRVMQGGHDVPTERLARRYEQSLKNLVAALAFVPTVRVFDNSSQERPYRLILRTENGAVIESPEPTPDWLMHALRRDS
jgi:predicted ABC-type ATPase